jgi:beta-xylosidase
MRSEQQQDSGQAGASGTTSTAGTPRGPWQDVSLPVAERVADLLGRMTVEEKVAQLYGVWVGADANGDGVAPHQHEMVDAVDWPTLITTGLGQLTRPFGTAPIDAGVGAAALAGAQAQIMAANRFGIPAMAHEECLAGFTAFGATIYPVPLAWGATFDPDLVSAMAERIGAGLRSVGVHQGLAPVLDVVRDPRWGRVEETIGEDPYLVSTIATAYVRGLESAGIVATLKHFVGYSASSGARNLAPTHAGPRELADVLLPPFEMAVIEGGARAVMHSYAEVDGLPVAADPGLLTDLLRDRWGFTGVVVADYFGVSFLQTLHGVAGDRAQAAGLALTAGVDVELPTVRCYGDPLLAAVESGAVPVHVVDTAVTRVLRQKCELGLLDPDWDPVPTAIADRITGAAALTEADVLRGSVDLDPPESRALAALLAEESVVLLANDGTLPLRPDAEIAVIGPRADDASAMFGCYAFPSHVGSLHPGTPLGVPIPTLLAALREELPSADITYAQGCAVSEPDRSGFDEAIRLAERAQVCVVAVGDLAGLFGRGTSGEGCDAADLALPGAQADLLDAVLATGTPVVLVLLTGRPYALGRFADRVAAVVQAFFPGEEGGPAVTGVLCGRVCPSGRLPVSVPMHPGGQPWTYLTPPLGHRSTVSNLDPTPLFPFGHGLSYTGFDWTRVHVDGTSVIGPVDLPTDGELTVSLTVRNVGERAGTDVVQLYLHDPVAKVTRPVNRLIGYARVPLAAGASARVTLTVPADLAAYTGPDGLRIVEPGDLELRLASSSERVHHRVPVRVTGEELVVDHRRRLRSEVTVQVASRRS